MLVSHPAAPFENFAGFVDFAKSNPGKLNYASAGNGTLPHVSMELLLRGLGIAVAHIPYRGAAPAMTDLLAGRIQVFFSPASTVLQHVRDGKLVAGMVAIEPGGPQIGVVDTVKVAYTGKIGNAWGITNMPMHYEPPVNTPEDLKTFLEEKSERPDEVPCYMQKEPVHKLAGMQNIRILSISAEGTYHRTFDVCIPKWLNQAGVKDEFVRLEDVGIHGNMHEMFLDRNSDAVIKFIDDWIRKTVK